MKELKEVEGSYRVQTLNDGAKSTAQLSSSEKQTNKQKRLPTRNLHIGLHIVGLLLNYYGTIIILV